jgi:hypothetical protein
MRLKPKQFVTTVAALALVAAGFTLTQATPASAVVTDSAPDQSGCESGGSAHPTWAETGGRTRPVVASMTVNGETVPDPEHPDDHKLGVAICTPFTNARMVVLNVIHREGMAMQSDLTGALTPTGAAINSNTSITITMTNLGSQAEFFTDAIIHGDITSYTTANLGESNASLTFTVKPVRTPIVDSTIPGSEFCSATPPICDSDKSEMDILAVNAAMDMDEAQQFQDMTGAYFAVTGAVAGYVTAEGNPGDGRYLKATLGGPHTLADGTTANVGSMQAFLPDNVLSSLLDIDPADLNADDFSVTRTEDSTSDDAPFTVTEVTGGAIVNVSSITFSTPVYQIASASTTVVEDNSDLGYGLVAGDGGVFNYEMTPYGSAASLNLAAPIVGGDAVGDFGYWLVAKDGGVFSYGETTFHGSMGGKPLNSPIVGMARTPSGEGYWLVASDGGIFAYGDAQFFGSMGGKPLNKPIVGMAAAVDGEGYTLFAADGGTFNYGSAKSYGSAASLKLAAPVVGGAMSITGEGYWMVAADGGVFSYGDATYVGTPKLATGNKAVGIVGLGDSGYAIAAADGAVYAYGTQEYFGGANALKLAKPIVGIFQGGYL